jgi:hypothetical protein
LSFPPSYRAFLARFGAAREGSLSVEIAGIDHRRDINETPLWTDVVRDTLRDHADATVPQRYLRISDDGMACAYYLDAGVEDGPVVALGPGRRDFEIVAPTFLDFVELATGEFPP